MNLSLVPSGSKIFVDSNILLYVFLKHPEFGKSCHQFVRRIESTEITGYIDEFTLNEVFHKLMITAIVNQTQCQPQQALSLAKNSPDVVKNLTPLWEAATLLTELPLKIIPGPFFPEAFTISQTFGLLATDSVHIAAMRKEGVVHIATNDADFVRVPDIGIWKPIQEG